MWAAIIQHHRGISTYVLSLVYFWYQLIKLFICINIHSEGSGQMVIVNYHHTSYCNGVGVTLLSHTYTNKSFSDHHPHRYHGKLL